MIASFATLRPASTSIAFRMPDGTVQATCRRCFDADRWTGLLRYPVSGAKRSRTAMSSSIFLTMAQSVSRETAIFPPAPFSALIVTVYPHAPAFTITLVIYLPMPAARCGLRVLDHTQPATCNNYLGLDLHEALRLVEQLLQIRELVLHVRDVHRHHEFLLEGRVRGDFDELDPPSSFIRFYALAPVHERHARAVAGRVAHGVDLVDGTVGEHAERHGRFAVDVAPEGPGKDDAVECGNAELLHHELRAGIERALCELERAHVSLGDGNVLADGGLPGPGEHVFGFPLGVLPDPRGVQSHHEPAGFIDDAGLEHLGDHLDDGRTAEALRIYLLNMRVPVR